jgi:hypothetical protein
MREIENFLDRARRYAEQLTAAKNGSAQPPEPDLTLAAMGPYLGGEKPVIFSASEYKDLLDTIEFAEKHKLKPIIYGGDQAWKLAEVLAEKDIPVILNTVTSMPRGPFEAWDSVFACVAALEEAGVRFAFSTGSSAEAYDLTHQAAMAAAFGLSPERAEFALTKGAADILGIGDQLGSIEPGKRADLIITTHSPLQMMSQVRAMFIDGRPIDLTSKHTEDYERFRNRPKPNLPPLPELTGPPSLTR